MATMNPQNDFQSDPLADLGDLEEAEQVSSGGFSDVALKEKAKISRKGMVLVPQPSDDPRDPLNWSSIKKASVFCTLLYATFVGMAGGVANVLATPAQAKGWHKSIEDATYTISALLAGVVVGPVLLVPLVRVFGVMSCCFWSAIMITVTSIWSAVSTSPSDYGSFIASRFVAGLFCGTAQVFMSGVIANMYFQHDRGKAFGIYSTVYLISCVAGPTFSGFIVYRTGWPVCFWWVVGAGALSATLIFCFGEDTLWNRVDHRPVHRGEVPESYLKRRIALFLPGTKVAPPNPWFEIKSSLAAVGKIAVSPITWPIGIYSMIAYSWFIMAGVQLPVILDAPKPLGFGFNSQQTAFFYFSAWVGALAGVFYGVLFNDRIPQFLKRRNKDVWKSEFVLHTAWFPGLIIGPIGCGLFGAAVYYQMHWIVLAVGEAFLVFAAVCSIPAGVNYLIEQFRGHPQEVGVVLNVWRIGYSISIQFYYSSWVKEVGVNWVWGTAAFIALFGFANVAFLMIWGPKLRKYNLLKE